MRAAPTWARGAAGLVALLGSASCARRAESAPAGEGGAQSPVRSPDVGPAVNISAPAASFVAGAAGALHLTVTAAPGWHFSPSYPTRIDRFRSSGILEFTVEGYRNEPDSPPEIPHTDSALMLTIPVRAIQPGSEVATARLRYALCSESTCTPTEATARWDVTITASSTLSGP